MPKFVLGRVVGPQGEQGEQGIQGEQGVQGEQGIPGNDGVTPSLQVGTVTTLPAGSAAAVIRRTGSTDANPIFDFAIPKGDTGATGSFSGNCFHRSFEPWEWTGAGNGEPYILRIPQTEHAQAPSTDSCIYSLRCRTGRNAWDLRTEAEAAAARAAIIAAEQAALAANTSAAGTYPTAADGHVILTWAQVQYYILDSLLVSAEQAEQAAEAKGFAGWISRPVAGAEETVTLDQVLTSAYLPAMGTPATAFDTLCTVDVLRGLGLRHRAEGVTGTVAKYDLDGALISNVWCVVTANARWDMTTMDLVVEADAAFSGDIMVMG